jgi:hypothetical protein
MPLLKLSLLLVLSLSLAGCAAKRGEARTLKIQMRPVQVETYEPVFQPVPSK